MKGGSKNVYAFIDIQNVYLAINALGWKIDFYRFRIYLREKYQVTKAFIFIGYISSNTDLYTSFHKAGFICIFKPVSHQANGVTKGNVDADLVLHTMIQFPKYDFAILISGDGDFLCLAEYLLHKHKLLKIIIPNKNRYSKLYKRLLRKKSDLFDFLSTKRNKLEYK